MFPALRQYVHNWMYPQPPHGGAYGFRWQAGQGVPNQLSIFDLAAGVGPGIYVAFPANSLATAVDPFERLGAAAGPVFAAPNVPSAAMTNMIHAVSQNPPPNEAYLFQGVTAQRLCDLTGFLSYTNTCLEIINHTAAGAQLLANINAAAFSVFIAPSNGGNQTFAGDANFVNRLTDILLNYTAGQPMPVPQMLAIINQRYANINGQLARFNQLAADMNNLTLCSLFQPAGAPNFLGVQFRFQGVQFTGQDLMDWLSPVGYALFDQHIRTYPAVFQAIHLRLAFLLAMNIVLYSAVPPGLGTSSGVRFNVRNVGDNVLGGATFRPPAIGLAHELMHAMHYGRGTAPGYEINHFTSTAAELLFTGIGPFANEPITENTVRGQWATIPAPAIDPSNVWAAPALRTIYDQPTGGNTAATLRTLSGMI
jgi:hypothetical protein